MEILPLWLGDGSLVIKARELLKEIKSQVRKVVSIFCSSVL